MKKILMLIILMPVLVRAQQVVLTPDVKGKFDKVIRQALMTSDSTKRNIANALVLVAGRYDGSSITITECSKINSQILFLLSDDNFDYLLQKSGVPPGTQMIHLKTPVYPWGVQSFPLFIGISTFMTTDEKELAKEIINEYTVK